MIAMALPDISDNEKMARTGRLSTLYAARRKAAQQLRDLLIPMLNSIEGDRAAWSVEGIPELVETITAINRAIEEQ